MPSCCIWVSTLSTAIIRFPSREAALGLYNDPAYQEGKRIRHESTSNGTMLIVEEFAGPVGNAER